MKGLQDSQKLVETSVSLQCKLDTDLKGGVEWRLRNTRGENICMNKMPTVCDTYVLLECYTIFCYGHEVCMRCNKLQCIKT